MTRNEKALPHFCLYGVVEITGTGCEIREFTAYAATHDNRIHYTDDTRAESLKKARKNAALALATYPQWRAVVIVNVDARQRLVKNRRVDVATVTR